MNRDDVIEIGQLVGMSETDDIIFRGSFEKMTQPEQTSFERLERFAELIAAREREVCTEKCRDIIAGFGQHTHQSMAAGLQPVIAPELVSLDFQSLVNSAFESTNDSHLLALHKHWYEKGLRQGFSIATPTQPVIAPEWVMLTKDEMLTAFQSIGSEIYGRICMDASGSATGIDSLTVVALRIGRAIQDVFVAKQR